MAKHLPPPAARLRWELIPDTGDRVALILAGAVVALDALTYLGGWRMATWGAYLILPSLPAAGLLALRCGRRLVGPTPLERRTWAVYLAVLAALAVVVGAYYALKVPGAPASDPAALAVATTGEELSFRLAWPLLIIAGVSRLLPRRAAIGVGYAIPAAVFCVLPGHVAQYSGPLGPLPFIAFAGLAAWVAARTQAIAATALAHATLDLLSFDVTLGRFPQAGYAVIVVAALTTLSAGAIAAGWASGRLHPAGELPAERVGAPGPDVYPAPS